jgi:replicative DNA helicase
VEQTERALLASVLFRNSLWQETDGLNVHDFSLDTHRQIFGCVAAMFEDQRPVDVTTLFEELARRKQADSCGGLEYLSLLVDHAFPENFSSYVSSVRSAAIERRAEQQIEALTRTCTSSSREKLITLREQAQRLVESLSVGDGCQSNLRSLFHAYEELVSVPPVSFAIEGFLQEEGITLIGGLAGHGKTLCMLAMARALLEGGKLFHHFLVNKPA